MHLNTDSGAYPRHARAALFFIKNPSKMNRLSLWVALDISICAFRPRLGCSSLPHLHLVSGTDLTQVTRREELRRSIYILQCKDALTQRQQTVRQLITDPSKCHTIPSYAFCSIRQGETRYPHQSNNPVTTSNRGTTSFKTGLSHVHSTMSERLCEDGQARIVEVEQSV